MSEAENEPIVDVDENLRIIGTAHVSKDSVELVDKQIEGWGPDVVAIELCNSRAQALKDERRLDQEGLRKVIKEGKAPLVLFQSMLAAEQRRLGMDEGVQPGAELLGAMNSAEEKNIEVALVDRDIQITLRRAWRNMGLREKWRILWGLVAQNMTSQFGQQQKSYRFLANFTFISCQKREFGKCPLFDQI